MKYTDFARAFTDPVYSAKLAGITYQLDDIPGWSRVRAGRAGFTYKDSAGKAITKEKDVARVKDLHIPPAWKEVWIAPSSRGHVQATGIDARGTKQYRYHTKWSEFREVLKFSRLLAFSAVLPQLRTAINKALKEETATKDKVAAMALELVDELAIRIGNDAYAKENKTYGVTTLQNRHIQIDGDTITLRFVGKSSKEHEFELQDKKLAAILAEEKSLPGTRLFQFEHPDGTRHPLTSSEVNTFIQVATSGEFTAKDFRTWIGTVYAYEQMQRAVTKLSLGEVSEKDYAKSLRTVITDVAEKLGNTVAVCKAHYVHAGLQKCYTEGTFISLVKKAARAKRIPGLSKGESETAYVLGVFARERRL